MLTNNNQIEILDFYQKYKQLQILRSKPINQIERLLRTEETNYLMMYQLEYYTNLKESESLSIVNDILANHPEISKLLRASLINWILHVYEAL